MTDPKSDLLNLLHNSNTLALATLNKEKEPEASYTPYIFHKNSFWIFVSQLSSHTENLLKHKQASILITEKESKNIFASTRVTLQCTVSLTEDNQRDLLLDRMTEQLGETVSMLRQLPDFYLLELNPQNGRFIAGFGNAFDITLPDFQLTHINPANG